MPARSGNMQPPALSRGQMSAIHEQAEGRDKGFAVETGDQVPEALTQGDAAAKRAVESETELWNEIKSVSLKPSSLRCRHQDACYNRNCSPDHCELDSEEDAARGLWNSANTRRDEAGGKEHEHASPDAAPVEPAHAALAQAHAIESDPDEEAINVLRIIHTEIASLKSAIAWMQSTAAGTEAKVSLLARAMDLEELRIDMETRIKRSQNMMLMGFGALTGLLAALVVEALWHLANLQTGY
jgi:hypothetical protein